MLQLPPRVVLQLTRTSAQGRVKQMRSLAVLMMNPTANSPSTQMAAAGEMCASSMLLMSVMLLAVL